MTLDTFRADRVGPRTPNLRKLADESVVFTSADSPVPLTLPAHCSILSGLLPLHHGVRNNGGSTFPASRSTLATAFSRAGYRTGAFVSAFVLDHRFGLARGFDTYNDDVPRDPADEANTLEAERRGDLTVDRALAWLRGGDARPFFAWVHLYDAHAPYAPPAPYPRTYDGEIAFVDAQVGRLLAEIDRKRTIVVVVGDHGEALGEHGELTHGLLLYEPTLHIPLIIAAPGAAARSLDEPVSSIDIAPTLAAAAEVALPATDGAALPLAAGRQPARRDVYAETEYPKQFGWNGLRSLRRGTKKLIGRGELYDLASDPGEARNALESERRWFHELESALAQLGRSETAPPKQAPVDEETRAKLASLGYIAPAAAPAADGSRPEPSAMAPLFRRFEEAIWTLNGGRAAGAITELTDLVARDPANPVFRATLARALRKEGRLEPAIRLYREAVAMAPEDAESWYNLAVALQEAGHAEEGGIAIREALRRDARRPEAHNALGIAHAGEGDLRLAEDEFRSAIALDERNARAWNNLANVQRESGRLDEARGSYERAIALAPDYADALNGLGVLDVQRDHPREALEKFEAALRIAPNHYEAQLNRGIALRLAGDAAGSAAQLRRLLEALPPGSEYDAQRKAARALLSR